MQIELTETQTNKFIEWQKSFGEILPYIGATGGHFGLTIIFTSIGMVVKGISWDGKEIDLTEY